MLVDIKVFEMHQEITIKDVEITDYSQIGEIIANTRVSVLQAYGDNDYAKKALKELNSGQSETAKETVKASKFEKASPAQLNLIFKMLNEMNREYDEKVIKGYSKAEASAYIKTLQKEYYN